MSAFTSSTHQEKARPVKTHGSGGASGNTAMRHRRRRGSTGTAKSMSGQLLGLSLFVMLLAFFIVLNAISSFEVSKVKPVMESLGYAFASRMTAETVDERPAMREDEDTSINEGETVDRIKALFTAQIPSHEAVINQRKGEMYVRIPYDDFEAAVMAVGQRNALNQKEESAKFLKGFFLPTLVALMKTEEVSEPYRMDMILNIAENPAAMQNRHPQKLAVHMDNMSAIAEKIEAAGLSTRLISTGLQRGESGMVELLFRRHVPYNPVGEDDE